LSNELSRVNKEDQESNPPGSVAVAKMAKPLGCGKGLRNLRPKNHTVNASKIQRNVLMKMHRRTFLVGGSASLLYVAPSDQIVLGVIGSGGRGTAVMTVFQMDPEVRVGAICDVYEPNLEKALAAAARMPGNQPKAYRNYKELLDNKDLQAVLIASPEHWHHRMVLDALAAGKDIYVEKPLCQAPEQGVELVEAEKRSKNIVQVGMQRRSYDLFVEARKVVTSGMLGTVRMVRSWWLNNYLNEPPVTKLDGKLDWEQWQGPAKRHPFNPNRFRNWRFFTDYAGGIVADQGAHIYDGIHMLMGAGYPQAVTAAAGKPHKPGVETPESVVVIAEYPEDFIGVFSINYAAMRYKQKNDQLNQLDGDKGRLDIGRDDFRAYRQGAEDDPVASMVSAKGFSKATDMHVQDFLECVRTRRKPTAPMALGFQSALVVQMANISLKQGRRVKWNAGQQKVEI
jgi:predicted dehydrogenase